MAVATKNLFGKPSVVKADGAKTTLVPKSIKKIIVQGRVKSDVENHLSKDLSRLIDASCDCV